MLTPPFPPFPLFPPSLLACRLLTRNCAVLHALGAELPFEITVGRNGRVWVRADGAKETMMIVNAIRASERLSAKQARVLVKELAAKLRN